MERIVLLMLTFAACAPPEQSTTFDSPVDEIVNRTLYTDGALPGFEIFGNQGCATAYDDGALVAIVGLKGEHGGTVYEIEWSAVSDHELELRVPPIGKVGTIAVEPDGPGYWLSYTGKWAQGGAEAYAEPFEACPF